MTDGRFDTSGRVAVVVPAFGMPFDAFGEVVRLNLHGTVYPSLIFGEAMAAQEEGSVINISSMAAMQAISGVAGYSAASFVTGAVLPVDGGFSSDSGI